MLTFYLSIIDNHDNDDDFLRIYYKYRKIMYKVAKSHTHDHYFAEDALQIAFVGVARNIDKIKTFDEKYLEIYLCTSAKNAAISVLRKESENINNVVSLETQYEEPETKEDITKKIEEDNLLNSIIEFIKSMKSEYRDVLMFHFVHGMTLKQCSIALHIPLSTVKTRLYKGQKLVIAKFKEYRYD